MTRSKRYLLLLRKKSRRGFMVVNIHTWATLKSREASLTPVVWYIVSKRQMFRLGITYGRYKFWFLPIYIFVIYFIERHFSVSESNTHGHKTGASKSAILDMPLQWKIQYPRFAKFTLDISNLPINLKNSKSAWLQLTNFRTFRRKRCGPRKLMRHIRGATLDPMLSLLLLQLKSYKACVHLVTGDMSHT